MENRIVEREWSKTFPPFVVDRGWKGFARSSPTNKENVIVGRERLKAFAPRLAGFQPCQPYKWVELDCRAAMVGNLAAEDEAECGWKGVARSSPTK